MRMLWEILAAWTVVSVVLCTVMSRAGLDTLVSLAGRLTGARARTTSESLAIPVRSRGRNQIVQADLLDGCRFSFGCHSLALYRRHFDEVTHVLDLSAQRR